MLTFSQQNEVQQVVNEFVRKEQQLILGSYAITDKGPSGCAEGDKSSSSCSVVSNASMASILPKAKAPTTAKKAAADAKRDADKLSQKNKLMALLKKAPSMVG